MKIFIGLHEVAGYYNNLKKGFDKLGVQCTFINIEDHPYKYDEGDKTNLFVALLKFVAKRIASTPRPNLMLWVWGEVLRHMLLVFLFAWASVKHDVFIFGYQSSFMGFYDLPILKLLNKKIIYMFHGSDSRPPYINGAVMAHNGGLTVKRCIERAREWKKRLKRIERYADVIISYPLHSHFHERRFVFSTLIGIPCVTSIECGETICLCSEASNKRTIRIVHSPSRPEAKGTARIRQAIRSLQARGYPIDFIEIIGKPNTLVLNELGRCDFIVDQLYSETPMAGFAAEAAVFGNPAIVGGYAQEEILRIFPTDKIPPVHYCHPDKIEEAIEKLIVEEDYRLELGRRAKELMENNWTPEKVARRYLRLIEADEADGLEDWLWDPNDIHYLHGAGLPEHRVKQLVRAVIERGGKEALQLSDKPELEHMFVEFAYSGTT
jgi:hypothetical protein